MTYTCCALVMEAKTSPLCAQVTQGWLTRVAVALLAQLQNDVDPVWGSVIGDVRVASSGTDVAPGEMVFAIVDSLPDAPGAIAYHDRNGNAVPVAFLALSTCDTLDDVSVALSHELVETTGDPACNLWADDGNVSEWARELCDAVESNSYPMSFADGGPTVQVSDFLMPAFFDVGSPPPWNFMAVSSGHPHYDPAAPFSTAQGGYQIRRNEGGGETQVTGSIPLRRAGKARHWSSRVYRRGART